MTDSRAAMAQSFVDKVNSPSTPESVRAKLKMIPIVPNPTGDPINTFNPPNRGPMVMIVSSILMVIMLAFVGGRIYSKIKVSTSKSWDDLTCALAVVGTIVYYASVLVVVDQGIGKHSWDIPLYVVGGIKYMAVTMVLLISAYLNMFFAKITLFILYRHIFFPNVRLRQSIHVGAIFLFVSHLAILITTLYFFVPHNGDRLFEHAVRKGLPLSITIASLGGTSVLIDLYLLILPILGVLKLQLSLRKKIGLVVVFSAGLLACICSAISLYYRIKFCQGSDPYWLLAPVYLLGLVEMAVAIICSCIPSIVSVVRHRTRLSIERHTATPTSYQKNYTAETSDTSTATSIKQLQAAPIAFSTPSEKNDFVESAHTENADYRVGGSLRPPYISPSMNEGIEERFDVLYPAQRGRSVF